MHNAAYEFRKHPNTQAILADKLNNKDWKAVQRFWLRASKTYKQTENFEKIIFLETTADLFWAHWGTLISKMADTNKHAEKIKDYVSAMSKKDQSIDMNIDSNFLKNINNEGNKITEPPPLYEFDENKVECVYSNGNFHLVRGNFPGQVDHNPHEFFYDDLKRTIQKKILDANKDKSEITIDKIDDISLITAIPKRALSEVMLEKNYYRQHSEIGEFINHPIWGQVIDPTKLTQEERKDLFDKRSVFPDHACELIENLKNESEGEYEKPKALYVHCEAGVDRTGEVIACFRMLAQGKSYQEAINEAESFAIKTSQRSISKYSKMGIQWYAYYLKEIKKMDSIGDIHDNTASVIKKPTFKSKMF